MEVEDIRQALQYAAWAADCLPKISLDLLIAATGANDDVPLREYTAAEIEGFIEADRLDPTTREIAARFLVPKEL